MTIGHIMLGVTDMERAVEFYRDRIGLTVEFGSPEVTYLNAGGVTLVLSTNHAALGPVSGNIELVFAADNVSARHAELVDRGVVFMILPRPVVGDRWAANFLDPDGHLLSIFGPNPG